MDSSATSPHTGVMAEYIFALSMLIVFFARDIQLLATDGKRSLWTRLLLYTFLTFLSVAFLTKLFPPFTTGDLCQILKSPLVWPVSLSLHFAGGIACLLLRRRNRDNAWTIALVPSPVLLISLMFLASLFRSNAASSLVALAWVLLIICGVRLLYRRSASESIFFIEFAGISNAAMLALVPVMLYS